MNTEFDALYPLTPGFQNTDTSKDAAEQVAGKAEELRRKCLGVVRRAARHDPGVLLPGVRPVVKATPARNSTGQSVGVTSYEAATALAEEHYNVHPRFSELRAAGLIRDSGVRRVNPHSMKKAIAWTPGDDPAKPALPSDNAPPAKPAARAAYLRGMAAAYHIVRAGSLQDLLRRLAELEPGNPDWES